MVRTDFRKSERGSMSRLSAKMSLKMVSFLGERRGFMAAGVESPAAII
jgi:hypothetical protein